MFEAKYYKNYMDSKVDDILSELISARKRGVDVKVILEGGEDFLGADFEKSSQATCDYLSKGGVIVRFDPRNTTTHAKLIVIDNSSIIIGSTNWNYNAIENNNEASVLINSPGVALHYAGYFDSLWKDSKECAGQ